MILFFVLALTPALPVCITASLNDVSKVQLNEHEDIVFSNFLKLENTTLQHYTVESEVKDRV